jgi:hypothetical protein
MARIWTPDVERMVRIWTPDVERMVLHLVFIF